MIKRTDDHDRASNPGDDLNQQLDRIVGRSLDFHVDTIDYATRLKKFGPAFLLPADCLESVSYVTLRTLENDLSAVAGLIDTMKIFRFTREDAHVDADIIVNQSLYDWFKTGVTNDVIAMIEQVACEELGSYAVDQTSRRTLDRIDAIASGMLTRALRTLENQ